MTETAARATGASPAQPVSDMLIREGAGARQIDLGAALGAGATFSVENSNGSVVTLATVDASGVLTLEFGALGHSDIRVRAADSAGTVGEDVFRVRVAGENAYTIAVLPDTQNYTSGNGGAKAQTFYDMTQWLVDNKESHDIRFVAHVGDITDDNLASQWVIAERALRTLDGEIPYSLLPGNHDQAIGGTAADHSTQFLDSLFSPAEQATVSETFGGVYDQELARSANNYHTFAAPDGTNWLVLSLEFGPRDDVLRWAGEVIEAHGDHRVLLVSHALTNWASRHDAAAAPLYDEGTGNDYGMRNDPAGANDGEAVYRELLSRYPNITMTFSGHIFGDGAETNVSYSQHGNPIFEFLANYQNGVAREITGNGNPALGTLGGNGAIRLVVVDPGNDTLSTETYFVDFDDYLDGFRVKEQLDRDGLTGPYRGHQEVFTGVDLGTPEARTTARAGDDLYAAAAPGARSASVALDASRTVDPAGAAARYAWRDAEGRLLAEGENANVELGVGRHFLTLTVTDTAGRETTDAQLVVVRGDGTLLLENFNDGNADGWLAPPPLGATALEVGSPASFGLPELPGGAESVVRVPALSAAETLRLTPNLGAPQGTLIGSYSVVFDVLVPAGQGTWTSFLQTDLTNASDGELFLQNRGNGTGGIGIGGNYTGDFRYGEWQRVAFTFSDNGNGTATLSKYVQGVAAGTQTVSGDRFKLDVSQGALLFADNDGETSELYASSVLLAAQVFTAAEVAALGTAKAGGILASAPPGIAAQFDFGSADLAPAFGPATLSFGEAAVNNFLVKGSVFSRPTASGEQAAPEASLWDQSDAAGNLLVWGAADAAAWSNYVLEATLRSQDNDAIGAVFYYRDRANYYRFTIDGENHRRELVKVQDGAETVLASVAAGSRFDSPMKLDISAVEGRIDVFLDGRAVFGGPVYDVTAPLEGGTVGLYSSEQRNSIFDDVMVNRVTTIAHAGDDRRVLDANGAGAALVPLDAVASTAPGGIASYAWADERGAVIGTDVAASVSLAAGRHALTLTVTGVDGSVAADVVNVEVVASSDILLTEGFASPDALAGWRIVDEGEMGGLGPDGLRSNWTLSGGRLAQTSDLRSRQLEWQGASNPDVWLDGWSPLGDGVNVLRRGTYALYEGKGAAGWTDYSVEARIRTADDDGLGFLFRYVDAENYYKLELDADGTYDRDPGNGAGPLFNLVRVRAGVEEILDQVPARYEPNQEMLLRVDVEGGRITAYLDGEAIFRRPAEDLSHPAGTIGLYSWGSEGLGFDDVTVVRLGGPGAGGISLLGTEGEDVLRGGTGDDAILALGGADVLHGAAGDDLLRGSEGDDVLRADGGRDRLYGENDDDVLEGGDGDDVLEGGRGIDVTIGGAGGDLHVVDDARDLVFEDAEGGYDTVIATGLEYALGAGIEVLLGTGADQKLSGGANGELIDGGAGADELSGGAGADTFMFGPGSGDDAVGDFELGLDRLDLTRFGFADRSAALEMAAQLGDGVLFDLGGGNQLLVRNTMLVALSDSILV